MLATTNGSDWVWPTRSASTSPTSRSRRVATWGAALLLAAGPGLAAGDLVVVSVRPGGTAARAGLRAGDRVSAWRQAEAEGTLASPFDLLELEAERGPRGSLELEGRRGDEPLAAVLSLDDWGLEVRPDLPPPLELRRAEALHLGAAGQGAAALARWRDLAAALEHESVPDGAAWALRAAWRGTAGDDDRERMAVLAEAAATAHRSGRPRVEALLREALGREHLEAERFDEARQALDEARRLRRKLDASSLATAALAEPRGLLAYERGKEMDEARTELVEARALQERLAPRSLALVRTLLALAPLTSSNAEANALMEQATQLAGELAPDSLLLARALQLLATVTRGVPHKLELARRALALRERLAPDGREVAASLSQIAVTLARTGQVPEALALYRRATAILEVQAPGSRQQARLLNGLAILERDRGNYVEAERLHRRSLEVQQRLQPGSIWVAIGLLNLATVLQSRHELAEAQARLEESLALVAREAPGSDVEGHALTALGSVQREAGHAADAERTLGRALALFHEIDPTNWVTLQIQTELGELALEAGRREEAGRLLREVRERAEQLTPGGVPLGDAEQALGDWAVRAERLPEAEQHYRAALALRRGVAPDGIDEATAAHALGLVLWRLGRREEALAALRDAVTALESQLRRLGGSEETGVRFRARYHEYFRDLEELLLEAGRKDEAYAVVERSRAGGLLVTLAGRDLDLGLEVPAALERERREADAQYDAARRRLARADDEEARVRSRSELAEARLRQEDVRARLRAAAPRRAAWRDPQPLDRAAVQRVLPPGTLLLTFSLGTETSRVYALGPGPGEFEVARIAAGEATLRREVARLRELAQTRRGRLLRGGLDQQTQALGRLLLGPVAERIAHAERVLVVPDGVLHLLPFAALRDPSETRRPRYVVESRPWRVVPSATLYAALAAPRSPQAGSQVVGFGDPAYGDTAGASGAAGDAALTRAQALGLSLSPLPATRKELDALRALAPGATRLWLGQEATEEHARQVGPEARLVHFATHGFVDDQFPLESGLALSPPRPWKEGRDNGLLQAFEVIESMRLEADLVTLSACDTALGEEVGGEGLLGLTWAFLYAGARGVLASLWEVGDTATGQLMQRFYAHLGRGLPADEALRRAQVELLRQDATAAPYSWAGFVLVGAGP